MFSALGRGQSGSSASQTLVSMKLWTSTLLPLNLEPLFGPEHSELGDSVIQSFNQQMFMNKCLELT